MLGQTLGTSGATGAASCSTTATTGSPAGSYPITCTQGTLVAANYSFGPFVAGTLSVVAPALVFTTAPQALLTTGLTSGTITVQRQGVGGTPLTTGAITVNLSVTPSGGGVFRNTGDSSTITSVSIASGSSGASFRFRGSGPGTPTITVSATGHTSGTQTETVQNPTLVFTTSPHTIVQDQTSGTITIARRNADGSNATSGSITVNLATTPTNGVFRHTSNLFSITSVNDLERIELCILPVPAGEPGDACDRRVVEWVHVWLADPDRDVEPSDGSHRSTTTRELQANRRQSGRIIAPL